MKSYGTKFIFVSKYAVYPDRVLTVLSLYFGI